MQTRLDRQGRESIVNQVERHQYMQDASCVGKRKADFIPREQWVLFMPYCHLFDTIGVYFVPINN